MQCIRVDLPEPEGPMIAVKRADGNATVTSFKASTSVSPEPYAFVAPSEWAAVSVPVATPAAAPGVVAGPSAAGVEADGVLLMGTTLPGAKLAGAPTAAAVLQRT